MGLLEGIDLRKGAHGSMLSDVRMLSGAKTLALWFGGLGVPVFILAVVCGGISWIDRDDPVFPPFVNRWVLGPALVIGAVIGILVLVASARELLREMRDTPCEHCGKRGEHRH